MYWFNSMEKVARIIICFLLFLMLHACATPKALLPKRTLHVIIYADGTCEYSFENMGSDERKYQKWRRLDGGEGPGTHHIFCDNERAKSGSTFTKNSPEIWPGVAISLRKIRKNDSSQKSVDGRSFFQPEFVRNHHGYGRRSSVADSNGSEWSVSVSLRLGTVENEKRLPLKPVEHSACGIYFGSDNDPNNIGYIYAEEQQAATGVYVEINTTVIAVPNGAAGPC